MKNYLQNSLRALFVCACVFFSLPILAEQVEIDGIAYNLVSKVQEATVVARADGKYTGSVEIPASVVHEGVTYAVTTIGKKAFYECKDMTSVAMPNSILTIENNAFYGCRALTSVSVPNSVTSIGYEAFRACDRMTSINIGSGVRSIGSNAFYYCEKLSAVHISDIAAWCSIDFDSNPLSRAGHLYVKGEEVKDLVVPASVSEISDYAFNSCLGLTSVVIEDGVKSIGYYSFDGCPNLTAVSIPASVHTINPDAFARCGALASLTLSDGVSVIGSYAFHCCKLLTSVILPNSLTTIGSNAFKECTSLTSITIPSSVQEMKASAFEGCTALTSATIKNGLSRIEANLFRSCTALTTVSIPNSVTRIGDYAFSQCSALSAVDIPESVTVIGERAFYGCNALKSIVIPDGVKYIYDSAFRTCTGLKEVSIGNTVTEIENYVFAGCEELTDVYCYAETVPSAGYAIFNDSYPEYITLHVPAESIEAYKAKSPWSELGRIVAIDGETPEPEVKKCATPVVSYADGKLTLTSATEDVEFITDVVAQDAKKYYEAEINLNATYAIETYAVKTGYENSDTVSVALVWVENGEVSDSTGVFCIEATPVLIHGNAGVLTISGVAYGTDIVVYTVSGTEVVRQTATEPTTTINTGLQSGTIAIVKVGNKSVKIKL